MIIHSPAPSTALQQLGTFDMSHKTAAQVVSISDDFWGKKKKLIRLLPDKSVVLPFVIDCKLERESGSYNTSCSVVVSQYYTNIFY